jgi:hypothetical protein
MAKIATVDSDLADTVIGRLAARDHAAAWDAFRRIFTPRMRP